MQINPNFNIADRIKLFNNQNAPKTEGAPQGAQQLSKTHQTPQETVDVAGSDQAFNLDIKELPNKPQETRASSFTAGLSRLITSLKNRISPPPWAFMDKLSPEDKAIAQKLKDEFSMMTNPSDKEWFSTLTGHLAKSLYGDEKLQARLIKDYIKIKDEKDPLQMVKKATTAAKNAAPRIATDAAKRGATFGYGNALMDLLSREGKFNPVNREENFNPDDDKYKLYVKLFDALDTISIETHGYNAAIDVKLNDIDPKTQKPVYSPDEKTTELKDSMYKLMLAFKVTQYLITNPYMRWSKFE